MNDEINFFAETTARGVRQKFGIKIDDRRRHMYVIGKTGMGKSQMLQNMAAQDIASGKGVGVVDPHGELAEALLDYIPKSRVNDVVYFNPADTDMPIGFNIMEAVGAEERYFVASGLMVSFEKIWADVWSERMKYILNNTILALLEYPNATILGANRMLSDSDYRKKVIANVKDPAVKAFWLNEFAKYPERYRQEAVGAIQNKIGQFVSNPLMRNIVGQVKSTFNVRDIMDKKKILIVNLSKGRIGEDNTALLGTMLITKLQIAAMSRVDIPEEKRNDFFFYIDEFQTFATPSFASILSEARKYRLALILAHQYIAQMDEVVRDAVFGNAGTLVCFRIGAADAEFLEQEFTPAFLPEDLVNLGKYNIALKLMIDGIASNAFSARTLPPLPIIEESEKEKIIRVSREHYGNAALEIEEKISRWSGMDSPASGVFESEQSPLRQSFSEASPRRLYDAICSQCKKETQVTFEPDPKRPVYCRDCFAKIMSEREKRQKVQPAPPPIRRKVNLTSLRETLKDVNLAADHGMMEEGKEITF
ncbi:MAG: type IV secretion system DNA-binding domain-containing protein [Candidatus Spechtbacteria bacterium]|nr:type IV secretion system DNA-binding domain-containing protein [Candidatus Spechtbacteria bacterium]